jgi:DNA polymerase-3 subunit epsilon
VLRPPARLLRRLSRRLLPQAPNHRLGTLASFCNLPDAGRAHRALADATTTAHLLLRLHDELALRLDGALGREIDHGLLCQLQGWSGARVERELERHRRSPVSMTA